MYGKKYYIITILLLTVFFVDIFALEKKSFIVKKTKIQIITGKVEEGPNNRPVIIQKWWSRSRVSNIVYGKLTDQVRASLGKKIRVKAVVFPDKKNPWKRKIRVTEILEVSELKARTKRNNFKKIKRKL